jgi:hypothetical protein
MHLHSLLDLFLMFCILFSWPLDPLVAEVGHDYPTTMHIDECKCISCAHLLVASYYRLKYIEPRSILHLIRPLIKFSWEKKDWTKTMKRQSCTHTQGQSLCDSPSFNTTQNKCYSSLYRLCMNIPYFSLRISSLSFCIEILIPSIIKE